MAETPPPNLLDPNLLVLCPAWTKRHPSGGTQRAALGFDSGSHAPCQNPKDKFIPLGDQDRTSLGSALPAGSSNPIWEEMSHKSFQALIYVAFMRNLLYKESYSIKLEMRPDS